MIIKKGYNRMKKILEKVVPGYLVDLLKEWKFKVEADRAIKAWEGAGKPVPPPSYFKNRVIRDAQGRYQLDTFIETGTFLGNTTEIQRRKFKRVFSVELSMDLYSRAKERFKKYQYVTIMQGDSASVLPQIMKNVKAPAVFWLDAHYSGVLGGQQTSRAAKDCPIYEEIDAIFANEHRHVILVDDARDFVGRDGYPTLKELEAYIHGKRKNYQMRVEHDIIRITPAGN
jgi:hypothetical protein